MYASADAATVGNASARTHGVADPRMPEPDLNIDISLGGCAFSRLMRPLRSGRTPIPAISRRYADQVNKAKRRQIHTRKSQCQSCERRRRTGVLLPPADRMHDHISHTIHETQGFMRYYMHHEYLISQKKGRRSWDKTIFILPLAFLW